MLENFSDRLNQCLNHTTGMEKVLVDEVKMGGVCYRWEVEPEALSCRPKLRCILSEISDSKPGEAFTQSFTWSVSDDVWADLVVITGKLLNAVEPEQLIMDPRGWIGRVLDRMRGVRHLNHIPVLAEQYGPAKHWMHATLIENRHGILVRLGVEYQGRSSMQLRIPLVSIRKLNQAVTKAQGQSDQRR